MSLALLLSAMLAQNPAPPAPAASPAPIEANPSVDAPPEKQASTPAWWQRFTLDGFARLGVFFTVPFQDEQLVGGNAGFRVADFRMGIDFRPIEHLTVYTSVELAAPLVDSGDPLSGRRIVEVRDAYLQYEFHPALTLRAGQFRPPYYAEQLLPDSALAFTSRSVLANGLNPPEAFGPRTALAPERQVGIQFSSQRLGTPMLGFKYALGLFNGNGPNQLFNDNNSFMPAARVAVDFNEHLTLGVNGFYNQRTDGARPNRLATNQLGYGADVETHGYGLSAMVAFLGKASTYSYAGLPPDSSLGALTQVRYHHPATGLEGALRGAFYEPSAAQPDDQVIEVAAVVAWRPFELPFRVLLQYTHRSEEARATYSNDSVDLMLHAVW